jgi:flavin reductase (DIM6/NTAB) family NADH-FMN oxidoreductase RutF
MTGLKPIASSQVTAPGFDEAELIIECRKLYKQPLDAAQLHSGPAQGHYASGNDVHDVFFGEVLQICGTDVYRKDG